MAEQTEQAALTAQPKAFTVPPAPELAALNGQIGGVQGAPFVPPTDYGDERKKFKSSKDVSSREAELLQRENQLSQEIGSVQQATKQYEADVAASLASQKREASQQIEANLAAARSKIPNAEFHPTKENMQDIATMFSLIGVIGMAMGGSGKMSAMNSLNSMSGMMKGWQQGRADLFKREKEEFDKNMAAVKAKLEDVYKDAERAYKTLAYNIDEANAIAAQSAAKLGGQVGKQILEKQGIESYFKYLDGVKKDLQHVENLEARHKEHQAQMASNEKIRLAYLDRKEDRKGRIKEKEATQIEGLDSLSDELRKLEKDFKPEYASLGILGFGAEQSMEAKRRLGTEEGAKAVQWWSRYERLQAPNRHALFGATLTGNELKNYQSFTAKKSDAPEIVRNMLLDQADYSQSTADQRRLALDKAGYTVPEVKPRPFLESYGGDTSVSAQSSIPEIPQGVPPSASYSPSQKKWWWKDSDGNWQSK